MTRLNKLLSLTLPYINSGQEPDLEMLAKEAGVDIDTAGDLLAHSMGRINSLKDKITMLSGHFEPSFNFSTFLHSQFFICLYGMASLFFNQTMPDGCRESIIGM